MPTIEELKELIDLKEIKKITLGDVELDIEKTLELMEETPIEYIFEDLEIWCKDFKIVIICEEIGGYDFDYDEYYFKKINLKPKTTIKVVPESLKRTWTDPETGKQLPVRTKAYYEKQKQDEIANVKMMEERFKAVEEKINKKAEEASVYIFEPFTVIKGGLYNNCRYITLPEEFEMPNDDLMCLSQEFYSKMNDAKVGSINFVGVAARVDDENKVMFRCNGKTFDKAPHIKEKVEKLIKEHILTPVVGFSPGSMRSSDPEEEIERIVTEFKKYMR